MHGVRAIRWLSFRQCWNTGPSDLDVGDLTHEQMLEWEKSPDREVSVEIVPAKSNVTFCLEYGAIGLEVDTTSCLLNRVYPEDGNTVLVDDEGTLRSLDIEQEESVWGTEVDMGWENALRLFNSVEDRETWSEGVVWKPRYKKVIVKSGDHYVDPERLALVAELMGNLPIRTIRLSKNVRWE